MKTHLTNNSSDDNSKVIIIEERKDKARVKSRISFSMMYFIVISCGWLGVNYILVSLMLQLEKLYKDMDFELSAMTTGVLKAGHKANEILEMAAPLPGWLMIGVPAVAVVLFLAFVCARVRILYFIMIAVLLVTLFFEIWALGSPFIQSFDTIMNM